MKRNIEILIPIFILVVEGEEEDGVVGSSCNGWLGCSCHLLITASYPPQTLVRLHVISTVKWYSNITNNTNTVFSCLQNKMNQVKRMRFLIWKRLQKSLSFEPNDSRNWLLMKLILRHWLTNTRMCLQQHILLNNLTQDI